MKTELLFYETVTNKVEIIVTAPDGMSEAELDDIVERVSSDCKYGDGEEVARILKDSYDILIHKVVMSQDECILEYQGLDELEEGVINEGEES